MTPYQIVSLAEMMKLPIGQLVGTSSHISDFARVMIDQSHERPSKRVGLLPHQYKDLTTNLENFCIACEKTGLVVTCIAARDFQNLLKQVGTPDGGGVISENDLTIFATYATGVLSCLPREASTKIAISIPPELAKYFEPTSPLFGDAVNDRFIEAAEDIEDAGRCLAFGQGTAAVMHLMRVAEVGLKSLAQALKIPYAPSWESYLNQIQTKIGANHKTKSTKWKKSEKFFRDVSGDLITIKQAWRNPTMHVDRKYYPDEAEVIFGAVRTLMQTLAEGLPQKKKTSK